MCRNVIHILNGRMPVMAVDQRVALNLEDLPMDVFELGDQGLAVESLTAGHDTAGVHTGLPR
jgi:hypothetical protein